MFLLLGDRLRETGWRGAGGGASHSCRDGGGWECYRQGSRGQERGFNSLPVPAALSPRPLEFTSIPLSLPLSSLHPSLLRRFLTQRQEVPELHPLTWRGGTGSGSIRALGGFQPTWCLCLLFQISEPAVAEGCWFSTHQAGGAHSDFHSVILMMSDFISSGRRPQTISWVLCLLKPGGGFGSRFSHWSGLKWSVWSAGGGERKQVCGKPVVHPFIRTSVHPFIRSSVILFITTSKWKLQINYRSNSFSNPN